MNTLKDQYKNILKEQLFPEKITEPANAIPMHYTHGKTRKPNSGESSTNGKKANGIPKK